jgi:hypothetical protein
VPCITFATGKSASFMQRQIASCRAVGLMVTRPRPRLQGRGLRASIEPLVVQREFATAALRPCAGRDWPTSVEVSPEQRLSAVIVSGDAVRDKRQPGERSSSKLSRDDCGIGELLSTPPRHSCSCSGSCAVR